MKKKRKRKEQIVEHVALDMFQDDVKQYKKALKRKENSKKAFLKYMNFDTDIELDLFDIELDYVKNCDWWCINLETRKLVIARGGEALVHTFIEKSFFSFRGEFAGVKIHHDNRERKDLRNKIIILSCARWIEEWEDVKDDSLRVMLETAFV